ncbi:type VI secretion system tip protein TssI/VgrG [Entomomonas asaccharolytica]|uniref:Type VI secretion system tip protein VgrG n=1 Tax=Entomomonas asaccharolytica TaxID=2785331 RepID=A0A974NDG6_9GAMM|nr:type VI secretion system tip protein TssI/VgrG [Entomomonas asaccharolytica]QQP84661.1 type VI secretion system tip protein VgrG [Entomomonas asaccharolytica]
MFDTANATHFSLEVQGLDSLTKLQVLSFEGLEAISSDYAFEVTLISNHIRFDITQLLSKPAFLSFSSYKRSGIHGIVQNVKRGAVSKHYVTFKIILTPTLTHLKKRVNQRVFRNKTVPEIIQTVLLDHGLSQGYHFEFKLKETYPVLEYCTQYDQDDYAFINHLAESEGIFYYFTHTPEQHTLIFADANPFFVTLAQAIKYVSDTGLVADERVIKQFDVGLSSQTTQASLRNYNFSTMKIPEGNAQGLQSNKANNAIEPQLESYDYPSRHWDQARADHLAKVEIERLRTTHVLAEANSDVTGLHAGLYISVTDHPLIDVEKPWLINQIRHAGKQPAVLEAFGGEHSANNTASASQLYKYFHYPVTEELQLPLENFSQGYRNVMVLTPQEVPYRPAKLHPKPKVLGAQTAIVTGAAGEEIYCDEYGRVKIQCHWDREGNYDEHSSHWVRVRSNWAHDGYGAVTIPRVGMEVLIEYEEGDPDFPIVVGALHNGVNKVPYDLPANKTKSVFKTSSSKGGVGSNEFRIEDKAGSEQIFVQAQKDFDQLTKNNHTVEVRNNSHLQVENEHSETIVNNRYTKNSAEEHHLTALDRKTQIMMNDYKEVALAEHTTVGTVLTSEAGMEIHLKAGMQCVIDGGLSLTLKAGGQHIILNPSGIWMTMPVWTGGVPMEGTPAAPIPPLHKYKGVASVASPPVSLKPTESFTYNLKYQLADDVTGKPYANSKYIAILPDNKTVRGITDTEGFTETFHTNNPEKIIVHLWEDEETISPTMGSGVITTANRNTDHSLRYQLTDDDNKPYAYTKYMITLPNDQIITDITDGQGYTQPLYSNAPEEIKIHLFNVNETLDIG